MEVSGITLELDNSYLRDLSLADQAQLRKEFDEYARNVRRFVSLRTFGDLTRKEVRNMEQERTPVVGEVVVYCDNYGRDHDALVTAVWGPRCINLVYISPDTSKQDTYGRQTERQSSCSYPDRNTTWGNYWRYQGDEKQPYTPPEQR